MTKLNRTSLTTHIWSVFISLIVVIFCCLFVVQHLFYDDFYGLLKKQNLITQINTIQEIVLYGNYETELDTLAFNENISIGVFYDLNDEIKTIYNAQGITTLRQAFDLIYESGKNYEQYNEETENEDGMIVCISYFTHNDQKCYVYISSPMDGSSIAKSITQYQILISASITMVFCVIVAYYFSKYLSKPIRDLNDTAFLLSNGNYEVTFPNDGYAEIKQLGDSLNKAKDELKKTDVLQKEFIANVSHDLRTPLTLIQSYAEMIRDISGDNKQKREAHLDVIISEVNRLSSLVTDVLELTKINANTKELVLKEVNISQLVNNVLDKVKLPINENKIKLTTNLDKKAVASIDEVSFNQVVYNFVLNAITYTKSEIKVNVVIENNIIKFTVVDNGDGIKKEDILQIWDRYYRSKENHERHKHGSGLGLSIVKSILEAHNFEYGVESTYKEGATFYVKIPLYKKQNKL